MRKVDGMIGAFVDAHCQVATMTQHSQFDKEFYHKCCPIRFTNVIINAFPLACECNDSFSLQILSSYS